MKGVKDILSNFITDKNIVDSFTSTKTIPYWEKALTHESINYIENYEKLEFIGDASVNYSFTFYLRKLMNITELEKRNNLLSYYMSKNYQPTIARKIGLDKMVICRPEIKITDDILEDIFEAFFGAFELISRKYHSSKPTIFKLSHQYVVDFFIWYFGKIDSVDLNKSSLVNKNIFLIYYHDMSRESTQKKFQNYFNPKTGKYVFNPQFLTSFGYYNKDVEKELRKLLTQRDGINEDYYISGAVQIMNNYGYDLEWITYEREKTTFSKDFSELAKINGYSRFILLRNNKESYDLVAQKNDPVTKESITDILKSYNITDFIKLKQDAEKYILENFIGSG